MDIQATSTTAATPPSSHWHLWAGKSFSFHDVLDAINPLQHLPIIATIYRHLTGDTIGNAARVAGDTLYGGPIGLALSLLNAHEVNKTGKDIGDHVVAMLEGDKSKPAPASADPGTLLASTPQPAAAAGDPRGSGAPHLSGLPVDSQGAIPMAAALAALKSKPAIDLSAFPGAQPAAAPAEPSSGAPVPLVPLPSPQLAATAPIVPSSARAFAIDTSSAGIAAMRGHTQSGAGVPFQLPAGVMLTNQPQPVTTPPSGADFALKMKQGLAKYQAMLAQQAAQHAPALAAQPAS